MIIIYGLYGLVSLVGFYIALKITNRDMGKWELVWYGLVIALLLLAVRM